MHTRQPSLAGGDSDFLAVEHEHQERQIIDGENPTEDTCNGLDVTQCQDPLEEILTHAERNRLLSQIHGDQHFR